MGCESKVISVMKHTNNIHHDTADALYKINEYCRFQETKKQITSEISVMWL